MKRRLLGIAGWRRVARRPRHQSSRSDGSVAEPVHIESPVHKTAVEALVEWACTQEGELAQAAACIWASDMLAAAMVELGNGRAAAIRALVEEGWSYGELATALGITRARIHQIVNR